MWMLLRCVGVPSIPLSSAVLSLRTAAVRGVWACQAQYETSGTTCGYPKVFHWKIWQICLRNSGLTCICFLPFSICDDPCYTNREMLLAACHGIKVKWESCLHTFHCYYNHGLLTQNVVLLLNLLQSSCAISLLAHNNLPSQACMPPAPRALEFGVPSDVLATGRSQHSTPTARVRDRLRQLKMAKEHCWVNA